ncbi:MAG TPA: tRNA lysidine(34) synthetase TilS [Bacteroidia bacterium]|nr:tRNA lysidine(34) synthetase TilS [Bacteroidia bacterium]
MNWKQLSPKAMVELFRSYIRKHKLLQGNKPVLVAVSGGIDSIVLMHLIYAAGIPFAVAHCNFKLRGKESANDRLFVKRMAAKFGVPFFEKSFNTKTFAHDNGLGIQEAARKLRYSWFDTLIKEHKLQAIATGHHADDLAETVLLHLVRGTGLAGLHGILPKSGKIIRPLLFATRLQIESYAEQHRLKWRDDSSNNSDYYTRNKLRRKVMPVLQSINPGVAEAFLKNTGIISDYEELIAEYISKIKGDFMKYDAKTGRAILTTTGLTGGGVLRALLFELLKDFGFNGEVCYQMADGIETKVVGSRFRSEDFEAVLERGRVVIGKRGAARELPEISVSAHQRTIKTPVGMFIIEQIVIPEGSSLDKLPDFNDLNTAYLDAKLVKWPLVLRPWHRGDRFRPLGMTGSRLVSDFITDAKLNNQQKDELYLLLSGGNIIWLAGYRIDNRFKLTASTRKAIRIKFKTNDSFHG